MIEGETEQNSTMMLLTKHLWDKYGKNIGTRTYSRSFKMLQSCSAPIGSKKWLQNKNFEIRRLTFYIKEYLEFY